MSFRAACFSSFIVLVVTLLLACQPDRPRLRAYPNPELDALRIKGVKYRIAHWPEGYKPDTLYVSERGIVDDRAYLDDKCSYYDSLNYLQRHYYLDDIFDIFIVRYHFRDPRHLVQTWIKTKTHDWPFDPESVAVIDTTDTILLEFDDFGRLVMECDSTYSRCVTLRYNDAGMLKTRTVQGIQKDSWVTRYSYEYDVNGALLKQNKQMRFDSLSLTYYYSDGLLDSLANSEIGTICRYEHIFY